MKKIPQWIFNVFFSIKQTILLKINSCFRYRVVDFSEKTYDVSFQCNETRAFFSRKILSAITDPDIICQIHSEQACYLGLMAGFGLRKGEIYADCSHKNIQNDLILFSSAKYCDAVSLIFDRYGNMIFLHPKNHKRCVMRPEYVISKKDLINLFHPTVACAIGMHVGYRKLIMPLQIEKKIKHLRLVKNS